MIDSGFTKTRVGTLTLGEKLKRLRSERRISLSEVSRATKIQIGYLVRLEEDQYDKLPADVYVKGFLRSYADFLGIESQVLIRWFEKERGIKMNLEKSRQPEKKVRKIKPVKVSAYVLTPKKMAVVFSLLLLLAGGFYLYREIGSFASAPRLVVLTPQNNTQVNGNSVTVTGVTDKDARLFINDQPVLVNDDGKFNEELAMQSGVNNINVKSVNKFDKVATASLTVQSNSQEKVAGDSDVNNNDQNNNDNSQNNSPTSATSDQFQMDVSVNPGPVWLSVEADGNLVFSGTMLSGAVQTFTAKDKIVFNSGKGNATFLKFNGHDIGALSGDSGAVRGVTFTKDTKY